MTVPYFVRHTCDRLGFSEPFWAADSWWAFPPHAVMAVPLTAEHINFATQTMSDRELRAFLAQVRWEQKYLDVPCSCCQTPLTWQNKAITNAELCEPCEERRTRSAFLLALSLFPVLLAVLAIAVVLKPLLRLAIAIQTAIKNRACQ